MFIIIESGSKLKYLFTSLLSDLLIEHFSTNSWKLFIFEKINRFEDKVRYKHKL